MHAWELSCSTQFLPRRFVKANQKYSPYGACMAWVHLRLGIQANVRDSVEHTLSDTFHPIIVARCASDSGWSRAKTGNAAQPGNKTHADDSGRCNTKTLEVESAFV